MLQVRLRPASVRRVRPADTAGQGVSCAIEELHQEKEKGEQLADREIGNYYNRRAIK